jgi:hypothetical protein
MWRNYQRLSSCVTNPNTSTSAAAIAAAAGVVSDCIDAIHRGRVADALPRLNDIKAQGIPVEGVDYARAMCFLSRGAGRNVFEARQSLLEELRLHPQHRQAQLLLHEVNEAVRPLLLPPVEVQKQHPLFALLCDALLDSTMLSWPRLLHLYEAADRLTRNGQTSDRGHIVECGTAGGGSAVLMAVVLAENESVSAPHQPRCVFALDTFAGMPAPGNEDSLLEPHLSSSTDSSTASWGTGTCCAPAAHVLQLARAFSVEDRLVVLPGLFQTSIPTQLLARPELQRDGIALLHIDADWYASTSVALKLLIPVMRRCEKGGVSPSSSLCPPRMVQVDDYHYWKGCRTAVDEYLAQWPPAMASSSSSLSPSHAAGLAGAPHLDNVDDNAVSFVVHRDTPFHLS